MVQPELSPVLTQPDKDVCDTKKLMFVGKGQHWFLEVQVQVFLSKVTCGSQKCKWMPNTTNQRTMSWWSGRKTYGRCCWQDRVLGSNMEPIMPLSKFTARCHHQVISKLMMESLRNI